VRTSPLVAVAALSLALAAPVVAAPPSHDSFSFTTAPQVIGQCDGADLVAQFDINIRETVYFDADGDPGRVRIHISVPGTITHTGTGHVADASGVRTIFEDYGDGSFKATGSGVHVVVPGAGTLNIEAGLEREADGDYRLTGHRITGATPDLCAALA
jgi:hypothetical protein